MSEETPPSFPFEDDLPLLILRSSGKTIAVTKGEPAVQSFLPFSLKACDVVRVTSKDALRQAHEDGYCSVVSKEWLIQVKVKVSLDPVREGTHWALLLDSCCGNGNGKEKVYMNSLSTAKRFKGTEDELRGVGVWLKSFQLGGSCELYLASEPSISDLCITKEIGRLRLHKEEDMGVNEQVFFGDTMDDIASLVETFLDSFFSNGLTAPKAIFWPSLLTYPLNIHYGEDKLRVAEHRAALLPMRRLLHLGQHIKEWPLTRKNVATMTTHVVPRTGKLWEKHLIRNIHTNLTPSSVINGSESFLVSGSYDYYHYRVDEFRDDGWGCAYRSLQTLLSWFQYEGLMNEPMPDIRKIQEILSLKDPEKMNRKEFVGSKDWIGSFEVMIVIQHFLPGLECTIRRMERGSDLDTDPSVQQLLVGHFRQRRASPVMIGGSSYAHTIIGVEANLGTMEARYLIADPHYSSGETNVKTILKKGYVGWKEAGKFFEANSWYNLCIPQLSSYDPR